MLDPDVLDRSHCCEMMAFQVRRHGQCTHGCVGPHDCGDCLIYAASDGSYGLLIHDGGASFVQIAFCPWCASSLAGGEWVCSEADGAISAEALGGVFEVDTGFNEMLEAGDMEALTGQDPGRRIDLD
jgi:hypothetical protein